MTKYLLLSAAIFAIGTYGVLARRNLLIVLMSLELSLNGVNIALIAFARQYASAAPHGQVLVLMVMAVAAAEVAIGLAILIALFRTKRSVDTGDIRGMRG